MLPNSKLYICIYIYIHPRFSSIGWLVQVWVFVWVCEVGVQLLIEYINNNNKGCFFSQSIHHGKFVQPGRGKQDRFWQQFAGTCCTRSLTNVTKCHNTSATLVRIYYRMFQPVVMCTEPNIFFDESLSHPIFFMSCELHNYFLQRKTHTHFSAVIL